MKRINLNFVLFALLFLSISTYSSSFAQLEEGTFVVKEHFSFHSSTSERNDFSNSNISTNNRNRYDFNTSFGYLVKENQEIGIGIGFGIGRENYESKNSMFSNRYNTDTKRYGASLYYRRYITIVEKLIFFVSPSLGYRYDIREQTENNISTSLSDTKTNSIGAYLYTGFLYNISPKFGLSINLVGAGLQYSSSKEEKEGEYISTSKSFSSSMYDYFGFGGLNLGVQFML